MYSVFLIPSVFPIHSVFPPDRSTLTNCLKIDRIRVNEPRECRVGLALRHGVGWIRLSVDPSDFSDLTLLVSLV